MPRRNSITIVIGTRTYQTFAIRSRAITMPRIKAPSAATAAARRVPNTAACSRSSQTSGSLKMFQRSGREQSLLRQRRTRNSRPERR